MAREMANHADRAASALQRLPEAGATGALHALVRHGVERVSLVRAVVGTPWLSAALGAEANMS
ncbi:hypothetical protein [Massilia niastensis]|uniref:hypothetical protein n=1 Tax=Massilia niastensis TaxID=544911 RepID=UPI00037A9CB5|nr:hypothetical protein [Massilia niastensis]